MLLRQTGTRKKNHGPGGKRRPRVSLATQRARIGKLRSLRAPSAPPPDPLPQSRMGGPLLTAYLKEYSLKTAAYLNHTMAIFHLRVSTFSRARGQSAVAAACYRAGGRMTDQRTAQRFDYRTKSPGVSASWLTGWAGTRTALWNAVERSETRRNSTVAREIQVALPRELNTAEGEALCRRYSNWLVAMYGIAVDTSIHRPGGASGKNHNPHAHLLMTTRRFDQATGDFGEKTREWDARDYEPESSVLKRHEVTGRPLMGKGCVAQVREVWEKMANEALALAGYNNRIDCRTLTEQGEDREPISRSRTSLELEKRGVLTAQAEEMKRREQRNTKRERYSKAKVASQRRLVVPDIQREETGVDENTRPTNRRRKLDRSQSG